MPVIEGSGQLRAGCPGRAARALAAILAALDELHGRRIGESFTGGRKRKDRLL